MADDVNEAVKEVSVGGANDSNGNEPPSWDRVPWDKTLWPDEPSASVFSDHL
jgi:hypothetical protein